MQNRREVGVAGQNDEFVEVRVVGQVIAHVHDHADIGRVFQLRRQRRAIHDLETGAQEMVPHEWERIHIGRVVMRVAARHGIAIAAVHDDTALGIAEHTIGRGDQLAVLDGANPDRRVLGETLGGLFALALQRQVDVVIVDKHRAQDWTRGIAFHTCLPPHA